MKFVDYMDWRACNGGSAARVTRAEAELLDVTWPLKGDWKKSRRGRLLDADLVDKLKAAFGKSLMMSARVGVRKVGR